MEIRISPNRSLSWPQHDEIFFWNSSRYISQYRPHIIFVFSWRRVATVPQAADGHKLVESLAFSCPWHAGRIESIGRTGAHTARDSRQMPHSPLIHQETRMAFDFWSHQLNMEGGGWIPIKDRYPIKFSMEIVWYYVSRFPLNIYCIFITGRPHSASHSVLTSFNCLIITLFSLFLVITFWLYSSLMGRVITAFLRLNNWHCLYYTFVLDYIVD